MTFDPDRRNDEDGPRQSGRSPRMLPVVLGLALLVVVGYALVSGWNADRRTTRESNIRTEDPVKTVPQSPPATVPGGTQN